MGKEHHPLLLLDNGSMIDVLNEGEFKVTNMSLEDTKELVNMFKDEELQLCFSNRRITDIMFDHLGIENKDYKFEPTHRMEVGQDGVVFKLYTTKSETQPVTKTDLGVEAKKVQNLYIYCQLISRLK